MKRFTMFSLLAVLLAIAASCSPRLMNSYGEPLTGRDTPVVVIKTFHNPQAFPVWVGPENETLLKVLPGGYKEFPRRSTEEQEWTLRWPRKKGADVKLFGDDFVRVGLFDGEVIELTTTLLYDTDLQPGVVINCHAVPLEISDNQGHNYGLIKPGQASPITQLWPGPITFVARNPSWPLETYIMTSGSINDTPDDTPWFDEYGNPIRIGWKFEVYPY